MIHLEGPLREKAGDAPSDERVARVEQAVIERRRAARAGRSRWGVGVGIAALVAAGSAAAAAVLVVRTRGEVQAPAQGARVEMWPAGAVAVREAGDVVTWTLDPGERIAIDVPPDTGRRWVVDAGWARVEVVGTQLAVARAIDRVTVDVGRGRVRVESAGLAGGVRVMEAGEHLEVMAAAEVRATREAPSSAEAQAREAQAREAEAQAREAEAAAREAEAAAREAEAQAQEAEAQAPRDATGEGASAAQRRARAAAPAADRARAEAHETTPSPTEAPQPDPIDDLLARADLARAAGRHAEAVGLLAQITHDHPADPRAGLATFTAARIQQDTLGDPSAAARSLLRALALGLPEELREDARARCFEAHAAAGDRAAAARAAADYLAHHPQGRRAAAARRVAGAAPP